MIARNHDFKVSFSRTMARPPHFLSLPQFVRRLKSVLFDSDCNWFWVDSGNDEFIQKLRFINVRLQLQLPHTTLQAYSTVRHMSQYYGIILVYRPIYAISIAIAHVFLPNRTMYLHIYLHYPLLA